MSTKGTKSPKSLKSPKSPRSPRNVIVINPLHSFTSIKQSAPEWSCKHIGVEIINYDKKIYRCLKCDIKGRTIKKFYQEEMLKFIK
jgi:hypothetical protein